MKCIICSEEPKNKEDMSILYAKSESKKENDKKQDPLCFCSRDCFIMGKEIIKLFKKKYFIEKFIDETLKDVDLENIDCMRLNPYFKRFFSELE
jgi:hypothetical protein